MSFASRYMHIPFLDGGRDHSGLDCWGLVRLVFSEQLSIDLPTYGEISAAELLRVTRKISNGAEGETWSRVGKPQAFDVAVMRGGSGWATCHVGIMVDRHRVLHTERSSGVCIEDVRVQPVLSRIASFRRHVRLA